MVSKGVTGDGVFRRWQLLQLMRCAGVVVGMDAPFSASLLLGKIAGTLRPDIFHSVMYVQTGKTEIDEDTMPMPADHPQTDNVNATTHRGSH